ncbi:hypothetical protein ATC03_07925 [Agromyces aureus]|uniref:Uncharacterized protein n=1 Tax=Agromyces aureus TaxID=453304 RepID=A0A191WEP1_9MICO|nr:hypothetical protein ATC03_07925 [Agromyces aureus]
MEADEPVVPDVPGSLVEAAEMGRREFLVRARLHIASVIDAGVVPAHALGRLIAEMERLDSEVRRYDDAELDEGEVVGDAPFDPSMI